ncbi:Bifunctional inhibitor/plant lipid transfer protein/seed storage helical domain [Dillenia turbinata]|uniref:Bifunctional inhibitor/plant lipid transfer protein/seed storage helical domain n=1 Tax=Dillenia turbinata TaxID=194707 RepID=A0AAN8ZCJ2_9MAGN
MAFFADGPCFVLTLAIALMVVILPVHGQVSSPCTASMISSFTPCMNYITNSSSNSTSPTADCCNALKTLTSGGMDCLCLIVTGSVPFQMPFNRSLAISLPRACNMAGVPVQCKASGAPVAAPGPVSLAPTLSPSEAPSLSPAGSVSPAAAPESDTSQDVTPASSTVNPEAPTTGTGVRPVLTPSTAVSSLTASPIVLLSSFGVLLRKRLADLPILFPPAIPTEQPRRFEPTPGLVSVPIPAQPTAPVAPALGLPVQPSSPQVNTSSSVAAQPGSIIPQPFEPTPGLVPVPTPAQPTALVAPVLGLPVQPSSPQVNASSSVAAPPGSTMNYNSSSIVTASHGGGKTRISSLEIFLLSMTLHAWVI